MHMMFVDESGDPGYPSNGNWRGWGGTKLFVRVGVIIHGWKWKTWNTRLLQFKSDCGLLWNDEIKASDIRKGGKAFSGWDANRRQQFIRDLAVLIGGNPDIHLFTVIIDKSKVDLTKKDRLIKPEVRSLELLLERYNSFLGQQKDNTGIVILDPVKESSDDNLRRFQSYLASKSEHFQPLHIVESTFFAKSHTSNMIQIADVCSNIIYRELNRRGREPEYRSLEDRFARHNGRIQGCGIKIWPK